jgi:hypothetical protein
MKIYELIKRDNEMSDLPSFIEKDDIKEVGYLKTFSGRKKKFFRFKKYQNIELFRESFDMGAIDDFEKEIKNYQFLQKKVKYYCVE